MHPKSRSHCDIGIIYINLVSSNVDVTNGYCGAKSRCSHGNGIFKTKLPFILKWVEYIPVVLFTHDVKICQKIKGDANKNGPQYVNVA